MPDENNFPTFEEFQELMNRVDRMYRVDNVTFCSDASKYPENPESAEFWFNHLQFNGTVYVMKTGTMIADMKHTPRISGVIGFQSQFELFQNILEIPTDSESIPGDYHVQIVKPKGEFTTYGHENAPNWLTFVFRHYQNIPRHYSNVMEQPQLFKIHTSKWKHYTRIEGNKQISGEVKDPISPLEIISGEQ